MSLTFAAPLALAGLLALPLIWLLLRVTPPRPARNLLPRRRASCAICAANRKRRRIRPGRCCCCASPSPRRWFSPWPDRRRRRPGCRRSPARRRCSLRSTTAGRPRRLGEARRQSDGADRGGGPQRRAGRAGAPVRRGRAGAGRGGDAAGAPAGAASKAPDLRSPRGGGACARLREGASGRAHRLDRRWSGAGRGAGLRRRLAGGGQSRGERRGLERCGSAFGAFIAAESAKSLEAAVLRAAGTAKGQGAVIAYDGKGQVVARASFDFAGALATTARFDLPVELRNDIAVLRIEGERSAGAAALLDAGARVRRVAMVSGGPVDETQPLLSPLYYLAKALGPFAQTRQARPGDAGPVETLLAEHPNVFALADVSLARPTSRRCRVLSRRAACCCVSPGRGSPMRPTICCRRGCGGPGVCSAGPCPGRRPRRSRSSIRQPLCRPCGAKGNLRHAPGAGRARSRPRRQKLGAARRRHALVTAERRGKGLIVLFHVGADTGWSNLPISGLFIDMLKRICAMSGESSAGASAAPGDERLLAPLKGLDGFGALGAPPAGAKPIRPVFRQGGRRPSAGALRRGRCFRRGADAGAGRGNFRFRLRRPARCGPRGAGAGWNCVRRCSRWLFSASSPIVWRCDDAVRNPAAARRRFAARRPGGGALAPQPARAEPQKPAVSQRDRDAALNARLALSSRATPASTRPAGRGWRDCRGRSPPAPPSRRPSRRRSIGEGRTRLLPDALLARSWRAPRSRRKRPQRASPPI